MNARPRSLLVAGLAQAGLLLACGGNTPPPETESSAAQASTPVRREPSGPRMQVATELGSIDHRKTEETFFRLQGKLKRCFSGALGRVEYLSGDLQVFLRVGEDGTAKLARFEDTTLGDREAEKCMLDAVMHASWPKPQGGEAEVRHGMGFDHAGDVASPQNMPPEKLSEVLGKHADDFAKCKEGVSGRFKATAYIVPDGANGKLQSVGMAPPSQDGEAKIDCLVEALKAIDKLPSPGPLPAKVSFGL